MFDTLYSVYRNQQKARQQAGLNQPFSTGLPEGIPNGNIPTQEQYNQRIVASANYANPVPMLPPEVGNIMSQGGYGSFGPSSLTAPPIAQEYQPVTEEVAVEEPQTLPNKEEVIGTVDTLAQQLRPSDNPSGASIHDEALKQINSILSSNDPQSKWQEQQDKPFWQRNDAYAGLIGVGLSLLSGASPIEAFQAGEGMRTTQARKDELTNNKAYLLDRYSADSVAQALASGDASLLKEKGMSQKDQFALQQAQGDLDYARRKDFAQFQNDLKGEDPGSWTSGGNGIIFNTRSGAVMNIGGSGSPTRETGEPLQPYKDQSTGSWMVPAMNKGRQTGDYKVANAAEQKNLETNAVLDSAGDDTIKQLESTNGVINQIEGHDAFGRSFGAVQGRLPNITEGSQEVVSLFNQLFSQQFLDNIKLMQGMGALSNAEGAKISAAQAALLDADGKLNQTLSEDFVKKQLKIIKDTNDAGMQKAKQKQNQRKGALSSDTPSSSFDASQVRITRN